MIAQQITGAHMVYKTHLHVFQTTILKHSFDASLAFFSRARKAGLCARMIFIKMWWNTS
jgi:hypothetical protein